MSQLFISLFHKNQSCELFCRDYIVIPQAISAEAVDLEPVNKDPKNGANQATDEHDPGQLRILLPLLTFIHYAGKLDKESVCTNITLWFRVRPNSGFRNVKHRTWFTNCACKPVLKLLGVGFANQVSGVGQAILFTLLSDHIHSIVINLSNLAVRTSDLCVI